MCAYVSVEPVAANSLGDLYIPCQYQSVPIGGFGEIYQRLHLVRHRRFRGLALNAYEQQLFNK